MEPSELVFISLDDWSLDSLLGGELSVVIGVAVVAVSLLVSLVAWLKGRRVFPIVVWLASLIALLLLLIPHSWFEDNLASVWEWLAANSENITLWLEGAMVVGGIMCVVGAVRLAKPSSWWAQRRYGGEKYSAAVERYGWSRVRAR